MKLTSLFKVLYEDQYIEIVDKKTYSTIRWGTKKLLLNNKKNKHYEKYNVVGIRNIEDENVNGITILVEEKQEAE